MQASALHITKGSKQGLPLAKLAHDIFSQSLLVGEADDCASRIGVPSSRHQERSTQNGHSITHTSTSGKPKQVGLIGLGAMGYGMANGKYFDRHLKEHIFITQSSSGTDSTRSGMMLGGHPGRGSRPAVDSVPIQYQIAPTVPKS